MDACPCHLLFLGLQSTLPPLALPSSSYPFLPLLSPRSVTSTWILGLQGFTVPQAVAYYICHHGDWCLGVPATSLHSLSSDFLLCFISLLSSSPHIHNAYYQYKKSEWKVWMWVCVFNEAASMSFWHSWDGIQCNGTHITASNLFSLFCFVMSVTNVQTYPDEMFNNECNISCSCGWC